MLQRPGEHVIQIVVEIPDITRRPAVPGAAVEGSEIVPQRARPAEAAGVRERDRVHGSAPRKQPTRIPDALLVLKREPIEFADLLIREAIAALACPAWISTAGTGTECQVVGKLLRVVRSTVDGVPPIVRAKDA